MSLAVSARYARAIADVAFESKSGESPDQLLSEVRSVVAELEASKPLREVLASPAVSHAKKRAVLQRLVELLKASGTTRKFLFVVSDHGRLDMLGVMAEAFQIEIDKRRGIVQADVVSAVELDGGQRSAFERQVEAIAGKKARVEFQVDPAVLGGAILKIGSVVYDGSVSGRLRQMSEQLAAGA